ncbi:MAG TPA: murein biosynthesis integral membrane protein MurJ [Planctomycetota bacterium]|nr:murein biosynthesis integral membrane protein MurJ [Planctomycetota bacterium]
MTRLLAAAGSISAFTLLSRIFGLVRDRLMAQTLGASWVQGTFLLAWTLPNLMRRLLGEGALSASLVPAYAKARRSGNATEARELLAQVTGTVITILFPLCLAVAVASLVLPAEWLPAPAKGGVPAMRLLLALNSVLFVYALPVCLTAVLSGALNTLGLFALPAAVPIVLNAFWIGALLLAHPLGITVDVEIANFAACSLSIGGFLQLLLVVVPLHTRGELLRPRLGLPRRGTAAFGVFVAMGPTVLGMSLNQVSSLLDTLMAYYLIAPGAVTYVYLANRLLLFPHALTAMSVAVAVFPKLAHEAHDTDRRALRSTLDLAAGATILVTLPASCGLIVLGDDVVRVLFRGGEFGEADVWPTVLTSSCLVAGLPFLGLAQIYARAFYAVGDTSTPARFAVRLVLLNAAINVTLLLTTGLGTAGLTLASSISSLANALLLAHAFHRHAAPGHTLRGAWARSLLATAAMCVTLPFVKLAPADGSLLARALGNVAWPIGFGMAVYVLVHVLLRSPELRALRRRRRRDAAG